MQNNLNNEDRILEEQLAEFVDQILANRETEDFQLSNISELRVLEKVALQLKQAMIDIRNPDPVLIERLRKNLITAWIAETTANETQRSSSFLGSKKVLPTSRRNLWFGLLHQRPLALGLGFIGVLATLLGIAIILEPQFNPGLEATAGGIAGWLPIFMVAVGVFIVLVVVWLSKWRK